MIEALQVPAPVRLQSALTYRPASPADAVRYLDVAEGVRETLLQNARPGEVDAFIVARCEHLILEWVHRYRRLLPYARYRTAIERVEAREPIGLARRMFDLGTLPAVAKFISEVEAPPATLTDPFAKLPEFQPLAEIRVDGLRGRLIVHIGSIAYPRALVLVSETDRDDDGPQPPLRHRMVRLLDFETADHGPVLRVSDRKDDGVVLARRGAITVECVIFNRPELLRCC